jgi:catechol 2,3-dioxygenase-like lactoylglutathione lyase family enzyme
VIPVSRLGHVTFETPDLEHQIAHYTAIVGLHVTAKEKDRAILATHLGKEVLILQQAPVQRVVALSLNVGPDADLKAAAQELTALGIASERRSDVTPHMPDALVFSDPNNTRVELYPKVDNLPHRPAAHEAAPIKLGHIAFMVRDPQQMVDFYCNTLGFRVSDWAGDFFAFLRCGPDHHTVNFLRGDEQRMHHFAFELKDWAHVQRACDHFGQKDVQIIWGPGRHGIGHNIFIYHFDPDQRVVEFYTELDQMKDEAAGYFEPRPWHKDQPQRPKVWTDFKAARLTWGPPPTPEYAGTHSKHTPSTTAAPAAAKKVSA